MFNRSIHIKIILCIVLIFIINYLASDKTTIKNYCFPEINKKTLDESLSKIDLSNVPKDVFKDILQSSENQKLIDERILFKTMQYMIEERDVEDPELISFVRDLITFTGHEDLNLRIKNKRNNDYSQEGQSIYIDNVLKQMRGGFFIEAGGYDGEDFSNTLYFELERNWTGLLIEPIPSNYKSLISKNRNIFAINACISNKKPIIAKFNDHNVLSGRVETMNKAHAERIKQERGSSATSFVYIPCFPLLTILKAMNVQKIDYFSLDVEGGEMDVLNSIPFDKIDIDTFTIEHNDFKKDIDLIRQKMVETEKYKEIKIDAQDIYLKKRH